MPDLHAISARLAILADMAEGIVNLTEDAFFWIDSLAGADDDEFGSTLHIFFLIEGFRTGSLFHPGRARAPRDTPFL